jgi:excisionase family DNA binding protein
MLTVAQTAAILGVSRMTVIRKADSGELPCVVISRGKRKTMRRFPKAFVKELALRAAPGRPELKDVAADWLSSIANGDDQPEQSAQHCPTGDPPRTAP